MGDASTWIAAAALGITIIVAVSGAMAKRPFVPATVVDELRTEVKDLRGRVKSLTARISSLERQLEVVTYDREWYREENRKLRVAMEGKA